MEWQAMRTTCLGDTGIETSVLGFGCADLFREPSRARRHRLLETAFDAGISHFDAAPMYGLGLVERELGRFARGRRDRVVIATKFGITPAPAARVLARVQGPLRRLLDAAPALRERARPSAGDPRSGAAGGLLYQASGYDARAARASLERSLRELRLDHVDILLLHDPMPGDVRSDDVNEYIKEAAGDDHSAKDFRTWHGTVLTADCPVGVRRERLRHRIWASVSGLAASAALMLGLAAGRASADLCVRDNKTGSRDQVHPRAAMGGAVAVQPEKLMGKIALPPPPEPKGPKKPHPIMGEPMMGDVAIDTSAK